MDRLIEVKVRGSYLTKDSSYAGVQGEGNAGILRIEFDEGWDGFGKTVTFWNARGENPVERILTADLLEDMAQSTRIYLCPIPGEAMTEAGEMEFVVDGWLDGVRQRSVTGRLQVVPAPSGRQGEAAVTPSQAEQLQVQIDAMLGNVQAAQSRAEEAQDAAEQAEANAREAEARAAAAVVYSPYIDENTQTWMVWDFAAKAYRDTGIAAECDPAVWIGSEPPEDESYSIWLNPEGEADSALAADYYTTERETFKNEDGSEVSASEVNAEFVYKLYDKLLGIKEEDRIAVKDDSGNTVTYEYVISTGEYNTAGDRGDRDTDIKKPKYLVLTGIHGNEKKAIISAYRFFKDLVERKNISSQFHEGAVFHVMPVGNKDGIGNGDRDNGAGVDINRNFDYQWSSEIVNGRNPGEYAGSEKETQAIMNWLKANKDAELFIDFHNSTSDGKDENGKTIWVINEVAMVVGLNTEEIKKAKRTALRGLDRVIPFWRYDRNYTAHNNGDEIKEPVFSYSSYYEIPGASVYYAADKLGIPSLCLECSSWQNIDAADAAAHKEYPFLPETVAAGAEALGNILLEFYSQSEDENSGKEGQFAVADGKGGIQWLTVYSAGEVGY